MLTILTDIEGTTSSISFVKDVLFPYARRNLAAYVTAHRSRATITQILEDVRAHEGDRRLDEASIVSLLCRWIDEDRKITPLKTLQGYIWAEGYRAGAFQGHVYEDALVHLRAWHARGLPLYVFSSGSVASQRLLFAHTAYGDLTPLFSGFFDTTTGAKRVASSYLRIASEIAVPPGDVLFLSDTGQELEAAREAGMMTAWLDRDEAPSPLEGHPRARSFDDVEALLSQKGEARA